MWDFLCFWSSRDLSDSYDKLNDNLSPNGKRDAKSGLLFLMLIAAAVLGFYCYRVYDCYSVTQKWQQCKSYSLEQIKNAEKSGKKLVTKYKDE